MVNTTIETLSIVEKQHRAEIDDTLKIYERLKKGLKKIDKTQDEIHTLLELDVIKNEYCDWEKGEHEAVINFEKIQLPCYTYCTDHNQYEMLCICSKKHIKYTTLLERETDGKVYMIGSSCIKILEQVAEMKGNILLKEKLESWSSTIQHLADVEKYKKCWGCMKLKVKKNSDYKDPRSNHRCGDCVHINTVHCYECKRDVLHANMPKKKIDGQMVIRRNPLYFKMCYGCWRKHKKLNTYNIIIGKYV